MTAAIEKVAVGLNAVIVAVTDEVPRILTVRRAAEAAGGTAPAASISAGPAEDALPFGPLEPETDRTLDRGLRRWVLEQTGLALGYVEQLYTFGDRDRGWPAGDGGARVVSVAYLALVREGEAAVAGEARWLDVHGFLPWEDWRGGRPRVIDEAIAPALARWISAGGGAGPERGSGAAADRRERADIAFGLGGAAWDGERVLERYELLYEAGLVPEARRDAAARGEEAANAPPPTSRETARRAAGVAHRPAHAAQEGAPAAAPPAAGAAVRPEARWWPPAALPGRPLALDHRRILATALGRLRGKLKYRPVVFELLPPSFTLLQLQRLVEALAGVRLHKQNFRRLVESGGLVEGTGRQHPPTGGRPAELFVFRREVLRERPAPGVGLPGARRG
ncbi:MAG TPA: hypothetical protein VKY89_16650 [Thermoanaerobaculia bacterium]|nr:hypothetical protein [Thermoanaerobaculia bacterium]